MFNNNYENLTSDSDDSYNYNNYSSSDEYYNDNNYLNTSDSEFSNELEYLYFKSNDFNIELLQKYTLYLERINKKLYNNIFNLITSQENNNNNFKDLINKTVFDFNNFSSNTLDNYKILEDDLNKLTSSYNELINDYEILKNKYNSYKEIQENLKEDENQENKTGFNSLIYNLKLFSWL